MMEILLGPIFVLSLLVFCIGMIARAVWYVKGLDWRLERVAYRYHTDRSIKGAFLSIFYWILPFGTNGWRTQPISMLAFFLLHVGAVLIPLFLLGHTVLLEHYTGISLPSLPQGLADILCFASIIGLLILVARRLTSPVLKQLNTNQDWFILLLTFLPFLTGLVARFGIGDYDTWMTLHVLTGEIFLFVAPFTKLSHIVLFCMSRAQLGMDYAIKRGGDTRNGAFPW